MTIKAAWVGAVVMALLCPAPHAATPEEIDRAVTKGVAFLYSQQDEKGSWDAALGPEREKQFPGHPRQTGGPTSLAVYALLTAGEKPGDERIQKALGYLKKVQVNGTYAVGFHAYALAGMPLTPEVKRLIAGDMSWIKEAMKAGKDPKVRGFYGYGSSGGWGYDRSTSQIAVLGAWGASQIGLNPGQEYWTTVERAWRGAQLTDGGWNYSDQGDHTQATISMAAAGVATLFITQDFLHGADYAECKGNAKDANIERGLKYLGDHFGEFEKTWAFYTLYGLERCGAASGYRYFGTHDWFAEGADWLVKHQAENGSWEGDNNPSTSFALLFLGRGRAPVAVNKLEYGADDVAPAKGAKSDDGNWNQRPLDVLNVCRWIGHAQERQLNFQIVNITSPIEAFGDAPVLFIAGNQALNFSEEKVAKLKRYVEEGGLIVGNADCSTKAFAESFKQLASKMFPAYPMEPLPSDHPIYTAEQFKASAWKAQPNLQAVSNGARVLMLLYASGDPAKYWELHMVSGHQEQTESMADVLGYAVSREEVRFKGQTHLVKADENVKDERSIKLARLQYAGNWDPEPGAWRRMAAILHNEQKVGLAIEPVTAGEGKLDPKAYALAHLTGTAAVKLDDKALAEIKRYVEGGGTLLVDASGGSTAFTQEMEPAIAKLFAQPGDSLKVLPAGHKLFAVEPKVSEVTYRPFAWKTVGYDTKTPLLRGIEVKGRMAVYFSREDLTAGMVGESVDGIIGYSPKSTREIVQHLLMSVTPLPAATQASAP